MERQSSELYRVQKVNENLAEQLAKKLADEESENGGEPGSTFAIV